MVARDFIRLFFSFQEHLCRIIFCTMSLFITTKTHSIRRTTEPNDPPNTTCTSTSTLTESKYSLYFIIRKPGYGPFTLLETNTGTETYLGNRSTEPNKSPFSHLSEQCEDLHTILNKPFFIYLGIGLGVG